MFLGAWKYNFYSENEIVNFHSKGSSKTLNIRKFLGNVYWAEIGIILKNTALGAWKSRIYSDMTFFIFTSYLLQKRNISIQSHFMQCKRHFHSIIKQNGNYTVCRKQQHQGTVQASVATSDINYLWLRWVYLCLQRTASPRDHLSSCGITRYKFFVATL